MSQLKQKQSQNQSLSPQQILQTLVLQLNSTTLEQKVLDELESNPLLESVDPILEDQKQEEDNDVDFEEDPDEFEPGNVYSNEKSIDDIPIEEQLDFLQGLSQQLSELNLTDKQKDVAEEIIWNLDQNGYLALDLILVADRFNISEQSAEKVLRKVQQLDPPGIGARNLQECLLLQLNKKNQEYHRIIVKDHFDLFINHNYDSILKILSLKKDQLENIIKDIKKLNPYPGEGKIKNYKDTIIPDLLVSYEKNKWKIIVYDSWVSDLTINKNYLEMAEQTSISKDTKKFLKEKYDSASWLIKAIEQRNQTLKAVMSEIIESQPDFFNGDFSVLKPMKLKDIADKLNMDISTISRSTRNKYVDTPYGLFELKFFFSKSFESNDGKNVSTKVIKDLLKQLIETEVKQKPLTDTAIANELKLKGFPIARRTVAKYREELKFPVARQRRQITS
ncbi:MAG: RNA polymerase factor sigma-54 [Candidatus Neomarinimicrobiota bacterium]|nr:RNA polymerase factor sigma-54 [Candidatus Neomarinimicrobiota bacterium]